MSNDEKRKKSPRRGRYWSVMLVGDHGRVVPFRHFKALAIGGCCSFILMLVAFIVMAVLYTNQIKKIVDLQSKITQKRLQNSQLRDEKDLYLTKLMLFEKKTKKLPSIPAKKILSPVEETSSIPVKNEIEPKVLKSAQNVSTEKQVPKTQWMADILNFSAKYDIKTEILKAQFRIYNKSKSKKRLSGRSVLVFKYSNNQITQWQPIPQVPLKNGVPEGSKGQAFQIKNYMTMRFRTYGQKLPVRYNAATAYVYSEEGQLLVSKDFEIDINVPLTNPKKTIMPGTAGNTNLQTPAKKNVDSTTSKNEDKSHDSPFEESKNKPVKPQNDKIPVAFPSDSKNHGNTSIPETKKKEGNLPTNEPSITVPKTKIQGEQP